ncbi:DNA-binding LytR/AlgR family response regulator [Hymenobacter luteus]|uniref:DNA-binding LytR/AlgR family response regulator n=2 Tax=Hymenobacter TaxID=89966 RepID=A0A7W9T3L6_9BACT|nr:MULTISPECIES: LytTR family DNA-binding domain-containing protein [Hymenobacter]MBB4602914.1 DNA-binding LytR/AlgR family response regulator [Hymenobacter latericoloratus]MBB6060806.1 DNA-binding LytR/AlgR family response regulator [Hymenobacter luteus]
MPATVTPLRALIIEDEPLAARRLTELLRKQPQPVEVVGKAESVAEAEALLHALRPAPDVLFLDIHLADGLSFELFERLDIQSPVIFTTAYDKYALRAFKVNSVDYLLKPIDPEELTTALQKLERQRQAATPAFDANLLAQVLRQAQPAKEYKSRFVVRVGEHLKAIPVEQIAYFASLEKVTLLHTREGRKFVVDYTLEQLEGMLDPTEFFRLNRAYLAHAEAIHDIIHYTNSRLQTILKPTAPDNDTVLVSREKVAAFKAWLDR